tara:strand:- start:791 stop:907 length:117 start_codon:yes stop_codon:yes gene_type:complete
LHVARIFSNVDVAGVFVNDVGIDIVERKIGVSEAIVYF